MKAVQCNGSIQKEWPGHMAVLWRRRCKAKTKHVTGYCHIHRHTRTTSRR